MRRRTERATTCDGSWRLPSPEKRVAMRANALREFSDSTPDGRLADSPRPHLFELLRLLPEGVHLRERRVRRASSLLAEPPLHVLESPREFRVGALERGLGVDLEMPRHVREHEQDVAEFRARLVQPSRPHVRLELGDLLVELPEHALRIRPVESRAPRLLGEPLRLQQRG